MLFQTGRFLINMLVSIVQFNANTISPFSPNATDHVHMTWKTCVMELPVIYNIFFKNLNLMKNLLTNWWTWVSLWKHVKKPSTSQTIKVCKVHKVYVYLSYCIMFSNLNKIWCHACRCLGVEAAMNWVFDHSQDDDFALPLQVASKTKKVDDVDPSSVAMIVSMGFSEARAKTALRKTVKLYLCVMQNMWDRLRHRLFICACQNLIFSWWKIVTEVICPVESLTVKQQIVV